MPVLLIPALGAAAGFGTGFFLGDSTKKGITAVLMVVAAVMAFQYMKSKG